MKWEAVIGLEVHVQLDTGRKLFCRDVAEFGAPPNTHICPVCMGLPGALPVLDREAVRFAVRAALALGCTVQRESAWARKSYFYPDLPKGYQITQFEQPLALGGRVAFESGDGTSSVRLRRLHLEEDAGKSVHGRAGGRTGIDLNRAGVPLLEIVTEPDLRSPSDARAFLRALKRDVEYLDVSDCSMEEGSLRVDANVSVREHGTAVLNTKVEIKNLNSFAHIEKALAVEMRRQVEFLERGVPVRPDTMVWDAARAELRAMRSKEESSDYRYFTEPDLPPLVVSDDEIEAARRDLPEMPRARSERLRSQYGLSPYAAQVLTRTRDWADLFEAVAARVDPLEAAKWIQGPVAALASERGGSAADAGVTATDLAELLEMVGSGMLSRTAAGTALRIMAAEGIPAAEAVEREALAQVSDPRVLAEWVASVLASDPEAVERFRAGETKLLGHLMGRVMEASRGRADPRGVRRILAEKLEEA